MYALALQADGKLLVGGDFTMANGLARRRIARLNLNGSLDQTFLSTSPFVGADSSVLATALSNRSWPSSARPTGGS